MRDAAILVVDDEPMLVEIFSEWLLEEGYRVHTAGNGAVALQFLKSNRVDVIVSDIRMPVMDGIALLRSLRESGTSMPGIIFVSGYSDLSSGQATEIGAETILRKPIRRDQFLGAIETALGPLSQGATEPVPER